MTDEKTLPYKLIKKMAVGNKYMIFTSAWGQKYGINMGIFQHNRMKVRIKEKRQHAYFISCRACSFHEYITNKIPFIYSF